MLVVACIALSLQVRADGRLYFMFEALRALTSQSKFAANRRSPTIVGALALLRGKLRRRAVSAFAVDALSSKSQIKTFRKQIFLRYLNYENV